MEPTGCGPKWRGKDHAVLVSLVTRSALRDTPSATPLPEQGIFTWVKLQKSAATEHTPYDFDIDLVARFVRKGGSGNGAVVPPNPQQLVVDASDFDPATGRTLKFLASVDLKEGQWLLYANGAATAPAGQSYAAVVGPRAGARKWFETNGKAWEADAAVVALVTLSTCYNPL